MAYKGSLLALFKRPHIINNRRTRKSFLSAIDVNTGTEIWLWNDIFEPSFEKYDIQNHYENDGLMTYTVGSRHYCINLESGATHWKLRRESSFHNFIEGIGSAFFIQGQPTDTLEEYQTFVVFQGDIQNGNLRRVLVPEFLMEHAQGNKIGRVSGVYPFLNENYTLLFTVYQDQYPDFEYITYIGLYNLTDKSWVYDKVQVNSSHWFGVLKQPVQVVNEMAYLTVNRTLYCFDIWNGNRIWKKDFPKDLLFSGFIVEDGKVIANSENSVLYCMNAETGTMLWEGEGAGTSSVLRHRYLNGIIYFSGGSTSRIHAVDAETGKTVWWLDPNLGDDNSDDWKPDLYVVPGEKGEKGKVIASTHMTVYCFEAYR